MSELTSKHVKNRMIYSSHEDDYLFNQKLLQNKTKIDLFVFIPPFNLCSRRCVSYISIYEIFHFNRIFQTLITNFKAV